MTGMSATIGKIEIVALTDTKAPFPLGAVFPRVDAARWAPWRERYPATFADAGTWTAQFGSFLLRAPGRTILVDTGVGPGPVAGLAAARGALPATLAQQGINPAEIDAVLLTHLHPDHVGWNLDAGGQPTFPRARYLVARADWLYFGRPEARAAAAYIDRTLTPLAEEGRLDLLVGETLIAEGVRALPTPGHTPGHTSVAIASAGEQACICGDVIVHPAQVTEPGWAFVADEDKEATATGRRAMLAWLEADSVMLAAGHFPAPGFGRVVRNGGVRRWEPW